MPVDKKKITLSVIITAHSEGVLIHRTLASVRRALAPLSSAQTYEIILHADNPTPETKDYIKNHREDVLKDVRIFENTFGDLGASRNFAVQQATGKYVATIDADDLMGSTWLSDSLNYLEKQTQPTVAHSEVTVEFEGANGLALKHGQIDHATDTLLSVYANRWNSVIVAPRKLLLEEPYTANSPGYGYEDWHLNCRLIAKGVQNVLIPHTVIFVRRKKSNSEWLRQIQSMAVLRANPLLAFNSIRSIDNPFVNELPDSKTITPSQKAYKQLKQTIKRYPLAHRSASLAYQTIRRGMRVSTTKQPVPAWLQKEWHEMHAIERQIFPTPDLMTNIPVYDTLTPEHRQAGALYKAIVDTLQHDSYDYLLFVPWLIRGGADKYAINYANTIAQLNPDKHVLVVATLPVESVWANQLDKNVDFVDFGVLTRETTDNIKYRLLGHLVENGGIKHIHVLNSELGYDFVSLHKTYLSATNRKIVATSFSQSVDDNGRVYGYSHTHVPYIYDQASLITSDNQAVLDMWTETYGFDPAKLVVHHQPVTLPEDIERKAPSKPLRILWAARVAPEKKPELLASIGKLIGTSAHIDMYGEIESGCQKYTTNLPENITYKGTFNGFSTLPLTDYDALLYTSSFDGMPNTVLEAASYKLPIIASAVGGIPEFIHDGDTGLLITDINNPKAYSEAIHKLASNPALCVLLSKAAHNKLQTQFSTKAYTDQVQAMLKLLGY